LTNEIKKHINIEDKIICATCYPLNYPSLSNLMKLGLSINSIKNKYDSRQRFILSNKEFQITNSAIVRCKSDEINKIQDILDDGYIGVEFKANKKEGVSHILFQKGKYLNEIE